MITCRLKANKHHQGIILKTRTITYRSKPTTLLSEGLLLIVLGRQRYYQ